MPKPMMVRLTRWFLANRLKALERSLVPVVLQAEQQHAYVSMRQLQLSIKALASARSSIRLLSCGYTQETEICQRAFFEAMTMAMFISWFPEDDAVIEWLKNSERPLSEKKHHVRQRVEQELPKRLRLRPKQEFPIVSLFDAMSNRSVHPTRRSAEMAWSEAAARHRLTFSSSDLGLETALRKNIVYMDTINLMATLFFFLRFLRLYVFSQSPIFVNFRRPSALENFLENWMTDFPSRFQKGIDNLMQTEAANKRKARKARGAAP